MKPQILVMANQGILRRAFAIAHRRAPDRRLYTYRSLRECNNRIHHDAQASIWPEIPYDFRYQYKPHSAPSEARRDICDAYVTWATAIIAQHACACLLEIYYISIDFLGYMCYYKKVDHESTCTLQTLSIIFTLYGGINYENQRNLHSRWHFP